MNKFYENHIRDFRKDAVGFAGDGVLVFGYGFLATRMKSYYDKLGVKCSLIGLPRMHDMQSVREAVADAIKWVDDLHPSYVVNCIGYTDPIQCEENPELSLLLNVIFPDILFQRLAEHDAAKEFHDRIEFLHISTGCVYGNQQLASDAEDKCAPACLYAEHKMIADRRLTLLRNPSLKILRPRLLFSLDGNEHATTKPKADGRSKDHIQRALGYENLSTKKETITSCEAVAQIVLLSFFADDHEHTINVGHKGEFSLGTDLPSLAQKHGIELAGKPETFEKTHEKWPIKLCSNTMDLTTAHTVFDYIGTRNSNSSRYYNLCGMPAELAVDSNLTNNQGK